MHTHTKRTQDSVAPELDLGVVLIVEVQQQASYAGAKQAACSGGGGGGGKGNAAQRSSRGLWNLAGVGVQELCAPKSVS